MNIERKIMKFDDGDREMVILDKGGYEIKKITEADVGKTYKIARSPTYLTMEQWDLIKNTEF